VYSFFLYAALVILTFYIPLYFQAVKGSTALASGVNILPLIIAMTLACIVGGALITMVGYVKPFMIIGTAVFTVGVGLLSTLGEDTRFGV
jgi:MFS transporter, DHA2 family, glioxin efflux transporter